MEAVSSAQISFGACAHPIQEMQAFPAPLDISSSQAISPHQETDPSEPVSIEEGIRPAVECVRRI